MAQLRIMATGQADVSAIRSESFRGRNYTVVPVIALVEGVLQGLNASEPEFAPADEFGKFPMTWNARPITLNHPRRDGNLCSANDPDIREEYEFGFIANTNLGDDNKLRMEAWIDDEIVEEKGGEFLEARQRCLDGEMVEVSTGLFCDVVSKKGTYNKVRYGAAWANVVPDHLAFLSAGTLGACSVEDGCGAPRLNTASPDSPITTDSPTQPAVLTGTPAKIGDPAPEAHACCDACAKGDAHMTTNTSTTEGGGNEPVTDIPAPATGEEPTGEPTGENQPGSGEEAPAEGAAEDEAGTSGDVTAEPSDPPQEPAEVAAEIEANAARAGVFERMTANAIAPEITFENARAIVEKALRVAYPEGQHSDCGCYYYRYTYILAMNQDWVAFETWNRGYEAAQTVAIQYSIDENGGVSFTGEPVPVNLITKIVPKPNAAIAANAAGGVSGADQQQEEGQMADEVSATTPAAGGEPTVNGAGNAPAPRTMESYLADAPPEIAAVLSEGIALRTNKKNALVQGILTNAGGLWNEAELNGKDIAELEKLHAMSAPKPDSFEGRAVPLFGVNAGQTGISSEPRDNQRTVPEAPRAFSAKPVRKADYSDQGNGSSAVAAA